MGGAAGRARDRAGLGIFLFFACAILFLCLIVGLASSTQTGSVTRIETRMYGNALASTLARSALDEAYFRFRFLASPGAAAAAGTPDYTGGPAFDWYGFFTKATDKVLIAPAETTKAASKNLAGAEVDPVELTIANARREVTFENNIGPQATTERIWGILQFAVAVRLRQTQGTIERRLRVSRPFRIYLNVNDYAAVTDAKTTDAVRRTTLRRALRVQRPVAEVVMRP